MREIEIQKQIEQLKDKVSTATNLVTVRLCNQIYEKIEKADYRLYLNKTEYFTKDVITDKFKFKNTYSKLSLTVCPKNSLISQIFDTANDNGELFWQLLTQYDYFNYIKNHIQDTAEDVMKRHNETSNIHFSHLHISFSDLWDSFNILFYFENPNQQFVGFSK